MKVAEYVALTLEKHIRIMKILKRKIANFDVRVEVF